MKGFVKLRTYRIAIIICVLYGGFIGYRVGSDFNQTEIENVYERGYARGWIDAFFSERQQNLFPCTLKVINYPTDTIEEIEG